MSAESVNKALAHFGEHRDHYLGVLENLVRIPSVSFDGFPAEEVARSAQAVAEQMQEHGLENVSVLSVEDAHPYVYGDWLNAPGKPTLLLYAHHDVQPPGDLSLWKSPPFEPTMRDGRLYARGAADDKAGVVVHLAAISSYLKSSKQLPINVKVVIEGEEEIGSGHLSHFLNKFRDRLSAEVMVLADVGNFDTGVPSLTISLRGLVLAEVEVRSLDHSIHSGMWGGPVPDPAVALSKMLATLLDDEGRIAIPGVYDRVRPLTASEREDMQKLDVTAETFRRQSGMLGGAEIIGGTDNPFEAIWRQPALTVNAIQASSRDQARNIICGSAWARVGIRIVPDQDADEIQSLLVQHLQKKAPWGVTADVKPLVAESWWMTDATGPVFERARNAFSAGYGRDTVFIGCGGSIPFARPFAEALGGVPALLIGVEDPYTNAHGENESLSLEDFDGAIRSTIHLFSELSR